MKGELVVLRKIMVILLLGITLIACRQNKKTISLSEVEEAIANQGLELNEGIWTDNIFMEELNGFTPESYVVKEATLSIYVFTSVKERKAGVQQFKEMTATMELVPYKMFEVNNVLAFIVKGDERTNEKVEEAFEELPH